MKPIILIGMMGAGKTTVGRRLAARIGYEFLDSDHEIEARCGAPVATVFDLEGEQGFRKREAEVINDLAQKTRVVISTGGGCVVTESTRTLIQQVGEVVYLRAQLADLWHRTRRDKRRPLLRAADPRQRLSELLEGRKHLYEEVAHWVVDTGRQPVEHVVSTVIMRLGIPEVDQEQTDA
jgi:shikimate kinase